MEEERGSHAHDDPVSALVTLAFAVAACVRDGTADHVGEVGGPTSQGVDQTQPLWTIRAPLPLATRGLASAQHLGRIYVFGGVASSDVPDPMSLDYKPGAFAHAFAYDPASDTWAPRQPMPIGLSNLAAHAIGERIYVFGGYSGTDGFNPAVLAYNPATDTWSQRSSRPAYNYIFMSASVGGRVFVIGGQGTIDNGPWLSGKPWIYENRVDIYDPETNRWSAGAPAPARIAGGAACAAGDRIYVFGEFLEGGGGAFAYAYDVEADAWSMRTPSAMPRNGQACVEINGEFHVLGGRSDSLRRGAIDTIGIYSPQSDTWRSGGTMPVARFWLAASLWKSQLFVLGGVRGIDDAIVDSVDMLDVGH